MGRKKVQEADVDGACLMRQKQSRKERISVNASKNPMTHKK